MGTGAHDLGGYIGDDRSKYDCIKERTEKLEGDICALRKTANEYPQKSYSTVARAVQPEWICLKCVTKDMGHALTGL